MSVKPVRLFTDPILHKTTELITDFTGLDSIAGDMIETMLEYKGVGLAGNQIGLGKNIVALYLENKTKIMVVTNLLNMRYNKEAGTDILYEGCLSCPGVSVPIKRFLKIEIDAQRLSGEKIILQFEGYDARIVQHEMDHLSGRLIVDSIKL